MTDEELRAIEEKQACGRCGGVLGPIQANALVAEVRRLRGLVERVQWAGSMDAYSCCPWCETESEFHPSNQKPHAPDCPAFTPDGSVR